MGRKHKPIYDWMDQEEAQSLELEQDTALDSDLDSINFDEYDDVAVDPYSEYE